MQKGVEFPMELCNIAKTVANAEQPASMAKYLQAGNGFYLFFKVDLPDELRTAR